MGFAQSQSSHLVGITGYTTPWQKEARLALGENLDSVVRFALVQFCLMRRAGPLPAGARKARYMGVVRGAGARPQGLVLGVNEQHLRWLQPGT